jgi:hypothetical protein
MALFSSVFWYVYQMLPAMFHPVNPIQGFMNLQTLGQGCFRHRVYFGDCGRQYQTISDNIPLWRHIYTYKSHNITYINIITQVSHVLKLSKVGTELCFRVCKDHLLAFLPWSGYTLHGLILAWLAWFSHHEIGTPGHYDSIFMVENEHSPIMG